MPDTVPQLLTLRDVANRLRVLPHGQVLDAQGKVALCENLPPVAIPSR